MPPPEDKKMFHDLSEKRGLLDYFVDRNAITASDILLSEKRSQLLAEHLGVEKLNPTRLDYPVIRQQDTPRREVRCSSWVLHFGRLTPWEEKRKQVFRIGIRKTPKTEKAQLEMRVNRVETRLKLRSSSGQAPREIQNDLFEAAHMLVWEDKESLSFTCSWFAEHGINLEGCSF